MPVFFTFWWAHLCCHCIFTLPLVATTLTFLFCLLLLFVVDIAFRHSIHLSFILFKPSKNYHVSLFNLKVFLSMHFLLFLYFFTFFYSTFLFVYLNWLWKHVIDCCEYCQDATQAQDKYKTSYSSTTVMVFNPKLSFTNWLTTLTGWKCIWHKVIYIVKCLESLVLKPQRLLECNDIIEAYYGNSQKYLKHL